MFLAIYPESNFVQKKSLEEIAGLPGAPFMFKYNDFLNNRADITPIDKSGEKITCTIGKYELVDVKKSDSQFNYFEYRFYHHPNSLLILMNGRGRSNIFEWSMLSVFKEITEANKFSDYQEYLSYKKFKEGVQTEKSLRQEINEIKKELEIVKKTMLELTTR